MSSYSKFPALHNLMDSIPFPGASWNEVLTTQPAVTHLHWAFFFAILCILLQIICYIITKIFAPYLIGYTSTPPLPKKMKINNKNIYIKLGEACNYNKIIDIDQYDVNELSTKYCNNKLSPKEVEKYLKFCNKHHREIQKNEKRFQECLFPVICKSFTLGFGIYAFYDKEWLYDRSLFYMGWPYQQSLNCCIPDIKLLYILHIGWYFYKLFAQTFLDRHLKDFIASLVHHCTTIVLMALSYHYGLVRVGVAVLLLHDPADIILQSAKLFRLMHYSILMNVAFASLVFVWFATRIVIYPYHCVLSTFIDFPGLHGDGDATQVIMTCSVLMTTLYILHLHWFYLIIQAVIRTLSGNEVADPRSDSEESDSDKNEPDKTKK